MGENVDAYRPAFTPAELRVIRLYALGLSRSEVCAEARIGNNTLNTHWKRIMEKTPDARCHIDVLRVLGWLDVPDSVSDTHATVAYLSGHEAV